jgi:hypothetical protein
MTDAEFVHEFFESLPGGEFHHRDHLRLAWMAVRRSDVERAVELVAHAIAAFASAHGRSQKFHRTLTEFWVRLVEHASRDDRDFDTVLRRHPMLLDVRLPERHWSRRALWSDEARGRWVEPDVRPLPA